MLDDQQRAVLHLHLVAGVERLMCQLPVLEPTDLGHELLVAGLGIGEVLGVQTFLKFRVAEALNLGNIDLHVIGLGFAGGAQVREGQHPHDGTQDRDVLHGLGECR